MLTNPVLLALAASTAVSATYQAAVHPGALAAKRDLVARQSDASSTDDGLSAVTACLDPILSIYSSLPTPPPDVLSWEETAVISDPCSITIPDSIKADFSSYETAVVSWFSDHSSELSSALSNCPSSSSIPAGGSVPDICGAGSGSGSGSGVTTTTDKTTTAKTIAKTGTTSAPTGTTGTSSGAGAASTTKPSGNAGPRETGFVAGAIALAGFMGVVAAL